MQKTSTVTIIGAGQAGLAMSHCLTKRAIDHVLLERGEVANSWRKERWDSLRLLTPDWMTRLPGFSYQRHDIDGYMTSSEVISFFDSYQASFDAPVVTNATVESVRHIDQGYRIATSRGELNRREQTGWTPDYRARIW